MAIKRAVIQHC